MVWKPMTDDEGSAYMKESERRQRAEEWALLLMFTCGVVVWAAVVASFSYLVFNVFFTPVGTGSITSELARWAWLGITVPVLALSSWLTGICVVGCLTFAKEVRQPMEWQGPTIWDKYNKRNRNNAFEETQKGSL